MHVYWKEFENQHYEMLTAIASVWQTLGRLCFHFHFIVFCQNIFVCVASMYGFYNKIIFQY